MSSPFGKDLIRSLTESTIFKHPFENSSNLLPRRGSSALGYGNTTNLLLYEKTSAPPKKVNLKSYVLF